jgi:predicted nucleic acid-binding protein
MRLLDTSVWIETLVDTALGRELQKYMLPQETCVVPSLVQHELYKWLLRERSPEDAERVVAYTMTCAVIDLTTAIALRAAEEARSHGLHTSDSIIYATALATDATLITCDAHFESLPHVQYFRK